MFEEHTLKKVIQDYLNKNLDQFEINLDRSQKAFDPDAIHDFRVAVKRIRSVVRAVNRSLEPATFPDNMILPLRLIFKAGGNIRDDQVQIGLVEELENEHSRHFPLIREFYQERIRDQRNTFFVKSLELEPADVESVKEQIFDALRQVDDHELDRGLYEHLSQALLKLRLKRYDLEKPERLHRFRTRFKQNGYIVEMIYQSKYDKRITKSSYNRMKNFGQELGTWHDYFQLRSKTALIFNESRNVSLLEEAFDLRKLITPIHDRLFQEILHQVKRDDNLFTF